MYLAEAVSYRNLDREGWSGKSVQWISYIQRLIIKFVLLFSLL